MKTVTIYGQDDVQQKWNRGSGERKGMVKNKYSLQCDA